MKIHQHNFEVTVVSLPVIKVSYYHVVKRRKLGANLEIGGIASALFLKLLRGTNTNFLLFLRINVSFHVQKSTKPGCHKLSLSFTSRRYQHSTCLIFPLYPWNFFVSEAFKRQNYIEMRFYVAGSFFDKQTVLDLMADIRGRGHEITHDWTSVEKNPMKSSRQHLSYCSSLDIEGVKRCDVLVALLTDLQYPYRGSFTEIGCALGTGKKVFILGPEEASAATNCFYWHPSIVHVSDVEAFWAHLACDSTLAQ